MVVIESGMRPLSTSHFNINSCSIIGRGRVDGLLGPRPTSTNITNMIISAVTSGRVAGLKIPMSTSSITHRYFKTFVIRNYVILTTVGGRMNGLMRPIS